MILVLYLVRNRGSPVDGLGFHLFGSRQRVTFRPSDACLQQPFRVLPCAMILGMRRSQPSFISTSMLRVSLKRRVRESSGRPSNVAESHQPSTLFDTHFVVKRLGYETSHTGSSRGSSFNTTELYFVEYKDWGNILKSARQIHV
jgi:hypothetical protein